MRACVLRVLCVMREMRIQRVIIICKRVFDVIARGYPCVAGVSHFVALVYTGAPGYSRVYRVRASRRAYFACLLVHFLACALVVDIRARVRSVCVVACLCLCRFVHEPPKITIKLLQCC